MWEAVHVEELEFYEGGPRLRDEGDTLIDYSRYYEWLNPIHSNWGVGRAWFRDGERLLEKVYEVVIATRTPKYMYGVVGYYSRLAARDFGDRSDVCMATAIVLYSFHRVGLSLYAHILAEYGLDFENLGDKSILYYTKQSLADLVGCSPRRYGERYRELLERYGSGTDKASIVRHWLGSQAYWLETPYNVWLLANIILAESRSTRIWVKSIQPSDISHGALYLASRIHGHRLKYVNNAARRIARRLLESLVIEINV